jgi:hypothetical protein
MGTVKNLNNFPFAAALSARRDEISSQLNVIDPKLAVNDYGRSWNGGKSTTIRA